MSGAIDRAHQRRALTRRALLDSVIALLLEQRNPRLSSTAIAERADVAVGTFYNHFASVPEALEQAFVDLQPALVGLSQETRSAEDVLAGFGTGIGNFLSEMARSPRLWEAARVAGWHMEQSPAVDLVEALSATGCGLGDLDDREVAGAAVLLCRVMTALAEEFTIAGVRPQLVGQAARMLASCVMDDEELVEEVTSWAETRYLSRRDET